MRRMRTIVGLVLVALCACGSSEPSVATDETADTSGTETTQDTTAGGGASAAPCEGAPWQTQDATATPPDAYSACASDADCAEARMTGCCGTFVVAVNARFQQCIAERNDGATCRARCAITPGSRPARTARCQESVCVSVGADGAAARVLEEPMYAE